MRAFNLRRPAIGRRIDLRRAVTNDFPLKATAVAVALLFWVAAGQNVQPREVTTPFAGRVPVERPEVPSGYVLRGSLGDVGVTLRGPEAAVARVAVTDLRAMLDISGAELPKVRLRLEDPTPYFGCDVLVVGGGNSAATSAMTLAEAGARVTLAMRRPPVAFQSHLRPFVVRDLEFAVEEKKLALHAGVAVSRIESQRAWLQPIAVNHRRSRSTLVR